MKWVYPILMGLMGIACIYLALVWARNWGLI